MIEQKPYRIEVDRDGCERCQHGRLYAVVGPDDIALGVMFEAEEDAEDLADHMNLAFEAGQNSKAEVTGRSHEDWQPIKEIAMDEKSEFHRELEHLLNRFSQEQASNTPDFILATYLTRCLEAWNLAVQQRETWYGRDARPASLSAGSSAAPQEK